MVILPHFKSRYLSRGFTLVELITVIVILGVLSIMVTGFIRFGTQIYIDAANRDEITASGRFAVERLNRELRSALPNSIRVTTSASGDRQCIEYVPIEEGAVYLDIPVFPEPASQTIDIVSGNASLDSNTALNQIAVYVLNSSEIYNTSGTSNKVHTINQVDAVVGKTNTFQLTLSNSVHFVEDSPTQRLFFVNAPVSYCVEDTQIGVDLTHVENLTRHTNYSYDSDGMADNTGVVMSDFVRIENGSGGYDFPFTIMESTQERNSLVLVNLKFTRNFEDIHFNNEIQVPNVP